MLTFITDLLCQNSYLNFYFLTISLNQSTRIEKSKGDSGQPYFTPMFDLKALLNV